MAGQEIECPACAHRIVVPSVLATVVAEPTTHGPVLPAPPLATSQAPEAMSFAWSTTPTEPELRTFVGRNAEYYLGKWSAVLEGNRGSAGAGSNWAAFLLLGFWLPYRKFYAAAAGVWAIAILIGIGSQLLPEHSLASSWFVLVPIAMAVGLGRSANQLYLAKARKAVAATRARRLSRQDHLTALARAGGTSLAAGLIFPVVLALAAGAASVALQRAGLAATPYGKRLVFNSAELYYMPPVTEGQARKLGEYLVKAQYFQGARATVQLLQPGGTLQVRFVVKQGVEADPKTVEMFKAFGGQISKSVFDDAPVEVHLCNPKLQSFAIVTAGG